MNDETPGGSILIVDDEKGVRDSLQLVLEYQGYLIIKAATGQEGLDRVEDGEPDVILLDVKMPGLDGMEVLQRLNPLETGRVVVMISGHADIATAVEATRMGAFDFLEKPLDQEKVLLTVRNAISKAQLARQNRLLKTEVGDHFTLVADSSVMQEVLNQVAKVAVTDRGSVIVTVQSPVPLHPAPLQSVKVEPVPAEATSVTLVPVPNNSHQSPGHAMPAGSLLTLPLPVPSRVTVNTWNAFELKVAVSILSASIVKEMTFAVLITSPDQPSKSQSASGAAVRLIL